MFADRKHILGRRCCLSLEGGVLEIQDVQRLRTILRKHKVIVAYLLGTQIEGYSD